MKHIYIFDRESGSPVVEVKDEQSLEMIKKIEWLNFDKEYYAKKFEQPEYAKDDFLGYYPAEFQPYIVEY